ncbi:MAG TPA: hypothetical protein VG672_18740, partial [Bryobacteraceae bacterium]|nr:hypothetical protein [Bryobacteraceae bacterium]
MGSLTFGLVAGFTVTALPFLLSRAGVSVDRIASISAVAMSPTFWGFLVVPVLDTGFSRRTYALVMTALSAGSLALSLFLFSPSKLALFTALVLIAELAVVLQTSAVMGWLSEFVPDSQRGAVGGWTNAANLGGGAFGAMGLMSAARVTTSATLGFVTLIAVLLSAVFLFWFPKPAAPAFHVREVFG